MITIEFFFYDPKNSTLSTGLNSMSGVILEDFIKPLRKTPISEKHASLTMKIVTVIIGVFCTLLAFVVEKLSGIIQVSILRLFGLRFNYY